MNQIRRIMVWLSRMHRCRGFGIQSPTDYWLVRYVINEHWPYYQYATLGTDDDWLRQKLGRLYLRLANWRQPHVIVSSSYADYWQAGCRRTTVATALEGRTLELAHVDISATRSLLNLTDPWRDDRSVIVVEGLWRDRQAWQRLVADQRVRVSFDLYYCGLLTFDSHRAKKNYVINF